MQLWMGVLPQASAGVEDACNAGFSCLLTLMPSLPPVIRSFLRGQHSRLQEGQGSFSFVFIAEKERDEGRG